MSSNTMRLLAAACSEIAGVGAVALLFYYLSITDVTRVSATYGRWTGWWPICCCSRGRC